MSNKAEEEITWERQYRDEQQARRLARLPIRQKEIESLTEAGYKVTKITDYQYRINDSYDLYPIHNRWHHLKTGKRGGAKNLVKFIKQSVPKEILGL